MTCARGHTARQRQSQASGSSDLTLPGALSTFQAASSLSPFSFFSACVFFLLAPPSPGSRASTSRTYALAQGRLHTHWQPPEGEEKA